MQMDHEAEIDRNFEAFQKIVGGLMPEHAGKHALLRNQSIVTFFSTAAAALAAGYERFTDGIFSVQEVNDRPLDRGSIRIPDKPR